ncbi:MAG: fatty acid desaturase [Rhizobiaceae bacterium]
MSVLDGQLRFAMFPALMVAALVATASGGPWIWLAALMLLGLNLLGDEVTENYFGRAVHVNPTFVSTVLYSGPVLTMVMLVLMLLHTAAPGTWMSERAAASGIGGMADGRWFDAAGATVACGIFLALVTVAFAHELIHRTRRGDWLIGQFICACCLHPSVAIDHVFGHHINVGTAGDASTAPRGMGFWRFLARAVVWETLGAIAIESRRLARRGGFLSVGNRFLQGMAMLASLALIVGGLAGWSGLLAFAASGTIGTVVFTLGNYISHYGLVRAPGCPIEPRHSWNAPKYFSASTLLNLPRHSHHHASGGTPFWKLEMIDGAPVHPHGWALMSFVAMAPPLWFRLMRPCLERWDADLASEQELAIIAERARIAPGSAVAA